jgi:hypothetical protein
MRTQKTLLVLGAGASQGFGLPLGSGLRNAIAGDLNIMFDDDWGKKLESGSWEIVEALRLLVQRRDGNGGDINAHRHAAIQISGSMRLSSSIDEYIERHKDDALKVQCAKLAIAKAILEAERGSTIYADPRENSDPFERGSDSWLAYMLRDLTRGLGKDDLPAAFENVTIIDFNYDRCVEHFSYLWFQRIYDLSENESAEVCRKLKIYHPYGSLGPLSHEVAESRVPYGGEINSRRLIEISNRIQTYSEAVDELSHPSFLKSDLMTAKRVVFLGFGFHSQNISILGAAGSSRATLRCYATTDGIPGPRLEIIKSQLSAAMDVQAANGLFFEDFRGNCEKFWNEYGEVVVH